MDDEVFERLTQLAEDADISRSRLLEQLVGQEHEAIDGIPLVLADRSVLGDETIALIPHCLNKTVTQRKWLTQIKCCRKVGFT